MVCIGCELWSGAIRTCYAGVMTNRYAGGKGWPARFEEPAIFPERLAEALNWPDLTNQERPDKPWLNGLPRIVFLNDMGDTFTEGLAIDWLMPYIEDMQSSPHCWLILTKRPSRMKIFFDNILGYVPRNIWLGTSITADHTLPRIKTMSLMDTAQIRFLSIEPILDELKFGDKLYYEWRDRGGLLADHTAPVFNWIILGGESNGRPTNLDNIHKAVIAADAAGSRVFVKQLGTNPFIPKGSPLLDMLPPKHKLTEDGGVYLYSLSDGKGGKIEEFPLPLQRREMPNVVINQSLL